MNWSENFEMSKQTDIPTPKIDHWYTNAMDSMLRQIDENDKDVTVVMWHLQID